MTRKEAYQICKEKAAVHMQKMRGELFDPAEVTDGDYYGEKRGCGLMTRDVWLASFVTGMGSLLFHTEGDKKALAWANSFAGVYRDKVFQAYSPTMHDIGFLYLPYSVHLYQLTGAAEHRDTALRAAEELAKRFDIKGHYIEAWSEMTLEKKREGRVIVDSSMNIPLLFWAWKESGHSFYYDIARAHLETVIKTLVREDYSVSHSWLFDLETGAPIKEDNTCGYANGSHWARGTAWLVFGLGIAYEYTGEKRYLELAEKVAEKYIDSLAESAVPVWDFRLPEGYPAKCCGLSDTPPHWDETLAENKKYNVDTSAAAIMICAFQLLIRYLENDRLSRYIQEGLDTLCREYLDTDTEIPGMLRRSNGRDAFTIYGDYYFMHALAAELYDIKTCWSGKAEQ